MGDSRRHRAFVRFVNRTFPWAASALVVADGKGQTARLLAARGVRVRVIEAEARYRGECDSLIDYEEGWFERTTPVDEDIILGMHPDEATAEIILAANEQDKPFAVVPCCVLGREAQDVRDNYLAWMKKLKELAGDCLEAELEIAGKNVVLYRRGPRCT